MKSRAAPEGTDPASRMTKAMLPQSTKTPTKKPAPPLEADVQAGIKQALELAGWTVLSTSARRQKAPSGVSRGVPDLLAGHPDLGPVWVGLEVKRSEAHRAKWSCPEQERLAQLGLTAVVWSAPTALVHAARVADGLGASALVERTRRVCKAILEAS